MIVALSHGTADGGFQRQIEITREPQKMHKIILLLVFLVLFTCVPLEVPARMFSVLS